MMRFRSVVKIGGDALSKPFVRFLIVSGLNAAFGYGLYALLIFFGLSYQISLLISTICGVAFNFNTIGKLVFKSSDNTLIFRFIATYIVLYGLNVLGVRLLGSFDINTYAGGALLLIPIGLIGYVMNKHFVFKKSST